LNTFLCCFARCPAVNYLHHQQPVQPVQLAKDMDPDMGSEFFETRQAFLSLCQGNHYQFDSLRRAKHSSMMVLYHLHNPEAPAFSSTCNFCHVEIEPGTGLRCTVCQDFDMCKNCKAAGMRHEHPMVVSVGFSGIRVGLKLICRVMFCVVGDGCGDGTAA
jgi:hypothetical protein